jgi:ArsR family transcriptional regulator
MNKDLLALDQVFKALADPTRVRILGLLGAGEICVCHIYESLRLPQPLVSRHLAYLRRAGLVDTRKDGLWVYYRMAAPGDTVTSTLLDTVRHILSHIRTIAKDATRLEKKTGCCAVVPLMPTATCCTTEHSQSVGRERPGNTNQSR